jgi:chromosome segregation ATPase
MGLLETVLLTIGASAATTALVIAVLRAGGPIIGKLFGAVLKTRAELDADRDRIIDNLREEIDDWKRRTDTASRRAESAEREARKLRDQLRDLNAFVDTLLSRLGTTRAAVEAGEPFRSVRAPRKPANDDEAGG